MLVNFKASTLEQLRRIFKHKSTILQYTSLGHHHYQLIEQSTIPSQINQQVHPLHLLMLTSQINNQQVYSHAHMEGEIMMCLESHHWYRLFRPHPSLSALLLSQWSQARASSYYRFTVRSKCLNTTISTLGTQNPSNNRNKNKVPQNLGIQH